MPIPEKTPTVPPPISRYQDKKSIKSELIESLKVNSKFNEEDAEKIAARITAKLPKGKKGYTEEDVFKAASSTYGLDNGQNLRVRDGIDGINNLYNVTYTTEEKTGNSKAIWEAISGSPDGDSRNIVSRSIGRLEKGKEDKKKITVDNIIEDLEAKGVLNKDDTKNPGLRNILKALKEKEGKKGEEAISFEQIKEAVKDDDKWRDLIFKIKGIPVMPPPTPQ
jgi:hypothetical protein